MVILSVECDDVEVEDGPLSDDDDDGRETQEAVIEDFPVAHLVSGLGLVQALLRSSSPFRHGYLFTATASSCGHTEDQTIR